MGMEGINWNEVREQTYSIENYLIDFYSNVSKHFFDDFLEEVCFYWASGNAISFGNYVMGALDNFRHRLNLTIGEIYKLVLKASDIYASKFNVEGLSPYKMTYDSSYGILYLKNPFQEIVNGITGMNKTVVDDYCNKLKGNINSTIETTKNNLSSIHLSIFDVADAQKTAFDDKIASLFSDINNLLEKTLEDIDRYKQEEEDRVDLAKQQTTSTFNQ